MSEKQPVSERLRVIISAFGATGHVFPALALARELRARGHEVLIETLERWRALVEEVGLQFAAAPEYIAFPGPWPGKPDRPTLTEATQWLFPMLDEFRPDVVVNDHFAVPMALAAEAHGKRRATLIPHVYPVNEPGLPYFTVGLVPPRTPVGAGLWRAARLWFEREPRMVRRELNGVRAELGLPPLDRLYAGISEGLALVATFPQLEYPRRWPRHVHVTGPMFFELPHPDIELPEGEEPLVLVAGSTALDQELVLVRAAVEALGGEPVRVLAALNQRGRPWEGPAPANAMVVDWVSYAQVMPKASVVVCNGGHGTIVRALAEGVPVVVCPGPEDMPTNGAHLAWSGAGVMLPRRLLRAAPLRLAVRRVLANERYRERAREISEWDRRNDAVARGTTLIEDYARR